MAEPGRIMFMKESGSIDGIAACEKDIPAITNLILTHGPNQWNYLPVEEVREHVAAIAVGSTFGIIAFAKPIQAVVGAVTYEVGHRYPDYQPEGREGVAHGYIAEAVVRPDYAGRGLGTALLDAAIEDLRTMGMLEIDAMRHADNDPSRRMMEKSGMTLVEEFPDPSIRLTGSGKTAVMQIAFPE